MELGSFKSDLMEVLLGKLDTCSNHLPNESDHPDRRIIVLVLLYISMLLRKFKIRKDIVMIDDIRIIDWRRLSAVIDDDEQDRISARLKGSGICHGGLIYLDRPESHKHFGFLAFREIWKTMLVSKVSQDIQELLKVGNGTLLGFDLEEGITIIHWEDFSKKVIERRMGFPEESISFGVQDFLSNSKRTHSKDECQEFFKNLVSVYGGEVDEKDVLGIVLRAFFTGNTEDVAALLINF
jgi:hypothetical protein